MLCGSHYCFRRFIADLERSQPPLACSAAPNHNNRQDLSLGPRRQREHRRVHLSSVSPSPNSSNSNSSLRQADLCSAILRLSPRPEARSEAPSSLHSQSVDCLEVTRPSNSLPKADLCSGVLRPNNSLPKALCSGAPRLSRLRVVDSLVRNSLSNNSKEGRFLAARNNRLSSREVLSLGTLNNPPPDRRHPCLGQHNSNLLPELHCLVTPSSRKRDPRCSETPNPRYLVPPPPRLNLNSNHPLWGLRSVRGLWFFNRLLLIQLLIGSGGTYLYKSRVSFPRIFCISSYVLFSVARGFGQRTA